MAKRFENGRGTRGLEKPITKRALRTERLLSVLRQASCASEGQKWLTVTNREKAELPGGWIDGIAATRKEVFVLWAEPMVFFWKEIGVLGETNGPLPD